MFQGLRTVVYSVDDITAARAWYARALGFDPYFEEQYYVGFNVGGYELGLHPADEGMPMGPGGAIAYWGVADIDAALSRLEKLGATAHSEVQDVGDGIRVATVVDPFGNLVGIIQNPHFRIEG